MTRTLPFRGRWIEGRVASRLLVSAYIISKPLKEPA